VDDEMLAKRLVFPVPPIEDVEVRRDLVYKRQGRIELAMDVYTPPHASRASKLGAVLFVHGGPVPADIHIQPKDWGVYLSYGELAAAAGLAGITFNHRYWSRTDLDQSEADVVDAISYVRDNADSLSVDPNRLCLWAFSGGGPLLSFALRERPDYIRCLVAYYAVLDLRHLGERAGLEEAALQRFSAAAHLGRENPTDLPIFLARAGQDRQGINESIDRFVIRALAANATLDVANHPEGQHAFDILNDDARTHEIIGKTVEFIKTHLRRTNASTSR